MQFKLAHFFAALAPIVSALTPRGPGGNCVPAGGCIPGPLQCCETLTKGTNPSVTPILAALGLSPNVNVGLSCNPVFPPAACDGQVLCCADNSFTPTLAYDCVPAIL
ncbi:hypothetical protein GYMLUDRAFT_38240 [Collybiopsis luxurians FD-317 M1]|nr:hypothetical protein GYMLUDRAFT_38240 [Collybiopsis luxurians FD-317 M1]